MVAAAAIATDNSINGDGGWVLTKGMRWVQMLHELLLLKTDHLTYQSFGFFDQKKKI